MVADAPLRVIFFGTPAFAVPSLRALIGSRHPVVALVSQPDRPRGRGQQLASTPTKMVAVERDIPVLQPERIRDEQFLETVRRFAPDLGVVAAYGKLLPDALLQIPRLGMINVHASLLPRWRGAAPVHRAVIAGDAVTGITIMRIVKELDAGPTFAAASRPIGPDETSSEVEGDLAVLGGDLLLEIVDAMAAGRAEETPQDETKVTYAPKVTKNEGAIDWHQSAAEIHDLIRGLQPWPLVSARLGGGRILLHESRPTTDSADAAPGTIVKADGDHLAVVAGDGRLLQLLAVQPDGRRVMSVRAFLASRRIPPGTRLEQG